MSGSQSATEQAKTKPPASAAEATNPAVRELDPVVLSTRDLAVWYGPSLALKNITIDIPRHKITALDRPFGLWQEHAVALLQPDERFDRELAGRGRGAV